MKLRGFTLIELMIVIAIIGIIAAIAIPNLLRARASANEASAISSLRTLVSSQSIYHNDDPDFDGEYDYATSLGELESVGLIDEVLASGEKSGYVFDLDASGSGDNSDWVASARPMGSGESGRRAFFVDQSGVIRFARDQGTSNDEDEDNGTESDTYNGKALTIVIPKSKGIRSFDRYMNVCTRKKLSRLPYRKKTQCKKSVGKGRETTSLVAINQLSKNVVSDIAPIYWLNSRSNLAPTWDPDGDAAEIIAMNVLTDLDGRDDHWDGIIDLNSLSDLSVQEIREMALKVQTYLGYTVSGESLGILSQEVPGIDEEWVQSRLDATLKSVGITKQKAATISLGSDYLASQSDALNTTKSAISAMPGW